MTAHFEAPLHVAILAVGGAHWMGGVTYAIHLIRALAELPEDERPLVSLVEQASTDRGLYQSVAPLVNVIPWPAPPPASILGAMRLTLNPTFLQDKQAKRLVRDRVACLFPCKFVQDARLGVPWVGWAVDFQHRVFPEFFGPEAVAQRDAIFRDLAGAAPLVVASSECVKRDFCACFPHAAHKVRVLRFRTVPDASWFEGHIERTRQRYHLPPRYLMVSNQFFRHKNHECVFAALKILRQRGIDAHVVCTGRTEDPRWPEYAPKLLDDISSAGMKPYVHVLGLIPRSHQVHIMRGAAAVVQPSLFEGWSTVVEDARCLGKRLFVSDIPVHREQDPPAAFFFDPWDPEALASALVQEWADLPWGVDRAAEETTRTEHRYAVIQFARDFMQIAGEAPAAARGVNGLGRRSTKWQNSSSTANVLTRAGTAM